MDDIGNKKYRIEKEGAQIYMDEKLSILALATISNINKSEKTRNNMVVPEIKLKTSSYDTVLFWMSILERFYLDYYYSDDGKRVSYYLISTDTLSSNMCAVMGEEITRSKSRTLKNEFDIFINQMVEAGFCLENKISDKNGAIKVCYMKVVADRYIQINKHLYDMSLSASNGDFRNLKSLTSIFLTIMKSARRKISSNKDRFKITSSVFFGGFTSIGDYLGMDRRTVSKYIHILAKEKIISYITLKKVGDYKELYFITDSMTEDSLVRYVVREYRSHHVQNVVKMSTTLGFYEQHNEEDSDVDFDSKVFDNAKSEFNRRAF